MKEEELSVVHAKLREATKISALGSRVEYLSTAPPEELELDALRQVLQEALEAGVGMVSGSPGTRVVCSKGARGLPGTTQIIAGWVT